MTMSRPRGRRVLGAVVAVLLAAGLIAVPEPAMAVTGCSKSWHYITHGETNLNLEPQVGAHGSRPLHATGGTDYWNQQFLFCRDPGWGANHYAIWSNMAGAYCSTSYAGRVSCESPAIEGLAQLFAIRRYDSTWWYITDVHNNGFIDRLLYPDVVSPELPPNPIVADQILAPLNGAHLFRITPSNLLG
jgi:hypothetical protein